VLVPDGIAPYELYSVNPPAPFLDGPVPIRFWLFEEVRIPLLADLPYEADLAWLSPVVRPFNSFLSLSPLFLLALTVVI